MSHSSLIKAVILLNIVEEATLLRTIIKKLPINIEITIAKDIDNFILLTSSAKMDCFILDWSYKQCPVLDLIGKMRSSEKYKNVSIIMIADGQDNQIQKNHPRLKIDHVFSRPILKEEIHEILPQIYQDKTHSIIPKEYNILILDNNPKILEIMSGHMEEIGHTNYKMCLSVKEAIHLIQNEKFDILLLDWNLDDGTCIDIIKFLNSQKDNALVIVITGRDDVEDIMTLLRYDVKDHIIKPFDHAEFKEKISYALERHNKKSC